MDVNLDLRAEFRKRGVEIGPGDVVSWGLDITRWRATVWRGHDETASASGWLPQPIRRVVLGGDPVRSG